MGTNPRNRILLLDSFGRVFEKYRLHQPPKRSHYQASHFLGLKEVRTPNESDEFRVSDSSHIVRKSTPSNLARLARFASSVDVKDKWILSMFSILRWVRLAAKVLHSPLIIALQIEWNVAPRRKTCWRFRCCASLIETVATSCFATASVHHRYVIHFISRG